MKTDLKLYLIILEIQSKDLVMREDLDNTEQGFNLVEDSDDTTSVEK